MLGRVRSLWRRARNVPALAPILEAGDRVWWARTIRKAQIVDAELVRAQGHRGSMRSAIRRYVRGGFRSGFSLNPLIMERLVASQLSDVGRVPALYAYLVNDPGRLELSINWDSRGYAATPGAREARGGPLGHAWRAAAQRDEIVLRGRTTSWQDFQAAVSAAAIRSRGLGSQALDAISAATVFLCRIDSREDAADALRLVASFAQRSVAVVIALSGHNADQWISAMQIVLRFPGSQMVRDHRDILAMVQAAAPGAVVLVRGPRAEISAEDLDALATTAREGAVTVPAWLDDRDGTVVSVGVGYRAGEAFDILAGHPAEDLDTLASRLHPPSVRGSTRAVPSRVTRPPAVLVRATVRAPSATEPEHDSSRPDTDLDSLISPTGFTVSEWTPVGPALQRRRSLITVGGGAQVPSLRWAIKTAAPPGARGEWWGDTHFARGIADALRRLGQEVVVDAYAARDRPSAHLDDVMLTLRGPEPIFAHRNTRALLWIISHPDQITASDLVDYDRVFAASTPWAAAASERFGRTVTALPQCTDAHRFRPHGVARSSDLVFVGTARGIPRPSVIEPLKAGIPVSVYGPDWSGWIPGHAIKASGIPNAELPALYEGAAAVLNDHWPAMRDAGFISNRLYDVVAAGGRAFSDHVDGIDDVFAGAVRTYRDIPELLHLVSGDLDSVFPSNAELRAISQAIRRDHSFDARARVLLDAALEL